MITPVGFRSGALRPTLMRQCASACPIGGGRIAPAFMPQCNTSPRDRMRGVPATTMHPNHARDHSRATRNAPACAALRLVSQERTRTTRRRVFKIRTGSTEGRGGRRLGRRRFVTALRRGQPLRQEHLEQTVRIGAARRRSGRRPRRLERAGNPARRMRSSTTAPSSRPGPFRRAPVAPILEMPACRLWR